MDIPCTLIRYSAGLTLGSSTKKTHETEPCFPKTSDTFSSVYTHPFNGIGDRTFLHQTGIRCMYTYSLLAIQHYESGKQTLRYLVKTTDVYKWPSTHSSLCPIRCHGEKIYFNNASTRNVQPGRSGEGPVARHIRSQAPSNTD